MSLGACETWARKAGAPSCGIVGVFARIGWETTEKKKAAFKKKQGGVQTITAYPPVTMSNED